MNKLFITSQNEFDLFCEKLALAPNIAIDTEFMRIKTYYPQFALLQIATGNEIAIIDPLCINEWERFKRILIQPSVNKIFHAASEDLGLFWHYFQTIPKPYIDTQILCSFLNDGGTLGLANALKEYLDVLIDKDQTRTDWLQRPLSNSQISYAYHDVEYLLPLYACLVEKLSAKKLTYALSECEHLAQKVTLKKDKETLYQQVSYADKLNSKQLTLLQALTKWRYENACQKDLALNFVVHEKHFIAIIEKLPTSAYELNKIGLHPNEILHHGEHIIELVNAYKSGAYDSIFLPKVKLLHANPNYKEDFSKIKSALNKIAMREEIALQLIASRKQINQLLTVYYEDNAHTGNNPPKAMNMSADEVKSLDMLSGWRRELCLDPLIELGYIAV